MNFHAAVLGRDQAVEQKWVTELRQALGNLIDLKIVAGAEGAAEAQVLFVDSRLRSLDRFLENLDRKGKAVFLLVDENDPIPGALIHGKVDDVLVYPFRTLEALGKLRHYQQILQWDEVSRLNASFAELLARLHDDLQVAERIQKGRFPVRFPELKGVKVFSRYLAGMRSGGDHFDLAESQDKNQLSLVLSDSSSYGLSSAVLSVLMRVAMKLSGEEVRSCEATVRKIHEELVLTLNEKDRLSLFYGVLSRKDYGLRYLNLGNCSVYYAPAEGSFSELPVRGQPITKAAGMASQSEGVLKLDPGGRLALLSDGFSEILGGEGAVVQVLDKFRQQEPVDCLNELTFQVKSKFAEPDDMPAQDCSAIVIDVDSRLIRAVG